MPRRNANATNRPPSPQHDAATRLWDELRREWTTTRTTQPERNNRVRTEESPRTRAA